LEPLEARKHFPALNTDTIYFNHAAIGPVSNLTVERINEVLKIRSENGVEDFELFGEIDKSAKQRIAKLLNADLDRVGWTSNVAHGMSIVAQGLNWDSGDRIILNDIEFPSNVYPFMNLQSRGVEIDFVDAKSGKVEIDKIEKLITSRTKLISVSLVQFLSGFRSDVEKIGEICRKNDIIYCVDVIQGAGTVQIDVKKSNIDFLTGGTHKWLLSLQGHAYLYITKELQEKISQKIVGWSSVVDAWNLTDYNLTLRESADRFQAGTSNLIGMTALDESLKLLESIGYDKMEEAVLSNSEYFIQSLNEIGANPILKDVEKKNLAGIVTFKVTDAKKMFAKLKERKISCAVREGMIRMSPYFYNTRDEINRVVKIIKELMD
jgi:selenocysteine lyase/cysteine desulfurase